MDSNAKNRKRFKSIIRVRPHILKVDVEGHDYEVLMGFLGDDVSDNQLPLLISFEAKSIMKKVEGLRAQLNRRQVPEYLLTAITPL